MTSDVIDAIIADRWHWSTAHVMDEGQPIYNAMYPHYADLAVNNWVNQTWQVNSFCYIYSGLFNHVNKLFSLTS